MAEEIARLVTVWDANFQKLDEKLTKIQRSHFKAAQIIKKDADALNNRLESRYGGVGKALDNVFNDSRLATIQAGSGHLRVFGSALEPLGAAGIVAAAGVTALAVAAQQTIAAMQFADEIDDASQKLNIGTEALQAYRFAMTEVGGDAKDADSALASFSETLGLAQSGLSPKAMKGFTALGFTKEQIDSWDTAEEALPAIAEKVANLGKETERAAAVGKLGLTPMLALLREGPEAIDGFIQKAQDMGYVMDAELVKKGADANQQFETMKQIIDVQLKTSFIGLSDEIVAMTGFLADALKAINDFSDAYKNFSQHKDLGSRAVQGAVRGVGNAVNPYQMAGNILGTGRWLLGDRGGPPEAPSGDWRDRLTPRETNTRLTPPAARGGSRGGGADNAEREAEQRRQREERFGDQLRRVQEEIFRAYNNQLLSIDDQAIEDTTELERDRQNSLRDIVDAQAEYARTNGLKGLSDVEAEQLIAAQNELSEMKKAGREWERRRDIAAYRLETEERAAEYAIDLLDIDSGLARNSAERSRIEREILISTQAIARKREEARLAEDNNLSDAQRAAALSDFDRTASGRLAVFDKNELDGLRETFKGYGHEVVQAIEDGRIGEYIGDQLRSRLMDMALDGLFDMLAGGGKGKAGGGFGDLFSSIAGMFGGKFAGGGHLASGKWGIINDGGGPEAIRARPGGGVDVLSHGALKGLGGVPSGAGARSQYVTFDNRGALIFEDVMAQQRAYADQVAAQSGMSAVSAARGIIPSEQARKARYRVGQ